MNKTTINEKIYEQYAEAATALVMEQYAIAMRESICAEPQCEEAVNVPDALNKKCRRLIHRRLAKERRKHAGKKLLRFAGCAAAAIIAVFGIGGILFTTVDAVRVPIINLFIDQKDEYIDFFYEKDNDSASALSEDPLAGLLPKDYTQIQCNRGSFRNVTIYYKNPQGDTVSLNIHPNPTSLQIDNENAAKTEKVQILSCDGTLIEKNGLQLIWMSSDKQTLFHLSASAMERDEFIALAENIVRSYK